MRKKTTTEPDTVAPSLVQEETAPVVERGKKKDFSAANMAKSLGIYPSRPQEDADLVADVPQVEQPLNGQELKMIIADYLGGLSIELGRQTDLMTDFKTHTLQQEQKQLMILTKMQAQLMEQKEQQAELKKQLIHQEQQQQLSLAQIQAQLDGQKQALLALKEKTDTPKDLGAIPADLMEQLEKQCQLTHELKSQLSSHEEQQQVTLNGLQAQIDKQMRLYQAQVRETEETLSSFVTINSHLVLSLKDQYQNTKEDMALLRRQQEYLIDKKIHEPKPEPPPPPPVPEEPPKPPKKRFLAFGKRYV